MGDYLTKRVLQIVNKAKGNTLGQGSPVVSVSLKLLNQKKKKKAFEFEDSFSSSTLPDD